MAEPAGELETLEPLDDSEMALILPRRAPSLTVRARLGMFIGLVVFTVGALVQILAAAWLGLLALLLGGSAEVLVHTGGLDPRTFATCSVAAIVVDAVILLAVATASSRRTARRAQPPRDRFAARHPFLAASGGLVLALAFVIAGGWHPSPYFPYPLATIVVLASAYWFGLVGVFALARLADVAWRQVKAWGAASEWRAGFLTACLVLAGAAGACLFATQGYAAPLGQLRARLAVSHPDGDASALSRELDALCVVADKLEPTLAAASAKDACGFLHR